MNIVLRDAKTREERLVGLQIESDQTGLIIKPAGYGTAEDPEAGPVFFEFYEGKPRLVIWSDKDFGNPTHVINLENSRIEE